MTTLTRDGGRWVKGISGNPNGFSKEIAPLVAEARRLALSYAPKSIEALASLLDNEDPEVRIAAATALLDRGGLRPFSLEPERLAVEVTPVDVDALRESLAVRVASLAAAGHLRLEAPLLECAGGVGVGQESEIGGAPPKAEVPSG